MQRSPRSTAARARFNAASSPSTAWASPAPADIPSTAREALSVRWNLAQDQIPASWFHVVTTLPAPLQPRLHPGTKEPVGPADVAPPFPTSLIMQEAPADP